MTPADAALAALVTATCCCLPYLLDRIEAARREPLARNPRRATHRKDNQ